MLARSFRLNRSQLISHGAALISPRGPNEAGGGAPEETSAKQGERPQLPPRSSPRKPPTLPELGASGSGSPPVNNADGDSHADS